MLAWCKILTSSFVCGAVVASKVIECTLSAYFVSMIFLLFGVGTSKYRRTPHFIDNEISTL